MIWKSILMFWAIGCPLAAVAFARFFGWSEDFDGRSLLEKGCANDNVAPMEAARG